jgi:uncharacterized membrane protein (UPF0127 family)
LGTSKMIVLFLLMELTSKFLFMEESSIHTSTNLALHLDMKLLSALLLENLFGLMGRTNPAYGMTFQYSEMPCSVNWMKEKEWKLMMDMLVKLQGM